jgi:hypothetical protein
MPKLISADGEVCTAIIHSMIFSVIASRSERIPIFLPFHFSYLPIPIISSSPFLTLFYFFFRAACNS